MYQVEQTLREKLHKASIHKISDRTGVPMNNLLRIIRGGGADETTRTALCRYFGENWEALNGRDEPHQDDPLPPRSLQPILPFWKRVDKFLSTGVWKQ